MINDNILWHSRHINPLCHRTTSFNYGLGYGFNFNNQLYSGENDRFNTGNYIKLATKLINAGVQGAAQNNYAVTNGTREQRLNAVGQSGATSSIIYTAASETSSITSGITSILALVPSEWYENKIGQLFEGWDCIGSSWSPKTGKQTFTIEAEFLKQRVAQTLSNFNGKSLENVENLINEFWVYFYSIQSTERAWLATSARDCTKRGLNVLIKSLDEFKKQELEPLFLKAISDTGHFLKKSSPKTVTYPPESHTGRHSLKQSVPQYRIQLNPSVLSKGQGSNEPDRKITSKFKTNSNNGVGAIILAAAAAGAYLYFTD